VDLKHFKGVEAVNNNILWCSTEVTRNKVASAFVGCPKSHQMMVPVH